MKKKINKRNLVTNLIEFIPYAVIFMSLILGIYLSHHINVKPHHSVGYFDKTLAEKESAPGEKH